MTQQHSKLIILADTERALDEALHLGAGLIVLCCDRKHFTSQAISSSSTTTNTLRNIEAASGVTVAFCPSLLTLHAYLAALDTRNVDGKPYGGPLLALVNALKMHSGEQTTGAFSAQSLSHTLALASEAALDTRRRLLVIETPEKDDLSPMGGGNWSADAPKASAILQTKMPALGSSYSMQSEPRQLERSVTFKDVVSRYVDIVEVR